MNVILQSFVHNPLLRAYFLSDYHNSADCESKPCLSCEIDRLFSQMYSGKKTPFGPAPFLHAMWLSQSHLAGYAQHDAHEFFISVLNEMHNNDGSADNNSNVCQCIVHQVFAGALQSDVTCQDCGNVTSANDPILDLSLDIVPPASAPKNQELGDDMDTSFGDILDQALQDIDKPAVTSLYDCLDK
jgi:ubiquitin carboxyl-terminal hydrolase 22/27/51